MVRLKISFFRRLAIAAGIIVGDVVLFKAVPFPILGVWDEPAHLATAVLFLSALARPVPRPFLIAALLGSVLIDLDHIPQLLGSHVLSVHTGRPYSHSLITVLAILLVSVVTPRWRRFAFGFSFGLLIHFSRDLVSGPLPLLWPMTIHPFHASYWVYALLLAALVAIPSVNQQQKLGTNSLSRVA